MKEKAAKGLFKVKTHVRAGESEESSWFSEAKDAVYQWGQNMGQGFWNFLIDMNNSMTP
jgi:hypothetical protein